MATGSYATMFLDDVGDGTGEKDAAVDGSGTPVVFRATPFVGYAWRLSRLIVQVRHVGPMPNHLYGALDALANGMLFEQLAGGRRYDLLHGLPVRTVGDWGRTCFDVNRWSWTGTPGTQNVVTVRWTFTRAGPPLGLVHGDEIRVVVRDDLSGLVAHTFCVQGRGLHVGHIPVVDPRIDGVA